jgi:hypothetical protein
MKNRKQGIIPEGEEALIWFSDFSYGPFCGWRPAVVTNEVDSEYEIVCRRGPEDLLVVAGTFHEYVEMIFSGAMWRKLGEEPIMEWTDEETGETHSSRCFEPIGRSPTSRT